MSLILMPLTTPTIDGPPPSRSPSRRPSTSWSAAFSTRRRKSTIKSPELPATAPKNAGLLAPTPTSLSSGSGDSRSIRSNRSRGRTAFKEMMNRFRSSSSVSMTEDLPLQESDFKQVEDWATAFDRYNQLVTTRTSVKGAYPSENFDKICNILTKNLKGRFVHALPEAVFDMALLWCPAESMVRRPSEGPSWSWTGWDGQVNFPFDVTNSPDLPRKEPEWFRSEVENYHVGAASDLYTMRREKREAKLHTNYPPYFHAPRGTVPGAESSTLSFSALTIPADGFSADQLHYDNKQIACSQLRDSKGVQCGLIMDYEEAISVPAHEESGPFEFVLISRNRYVEPAEHTRRPVVPTIHPPGTPIWDGTRFVWDQEVVDYDEDVYKSGPWKLLNVMLVQWVGEHAERIAVARIHEDAWLQRCPKKKHIVLQ